VAVNFLPNENIAKTVVCELLTHHQQYHYYRQYLIDYRNTTALAMDAAIAVSGICTMEADSLNQMDDSSAAGVGNISRPNM